jgi:23S rRNA pseudouridine1911/1915/1917 synthase
VSALPRRQRRSFRSTNFAVNPEPSAPSESQTNPDDGLDFELTLPAEHAGSRLDVALAAVFPKISRSYAGRLLKVEAILVNGKPAKASAAVRGGEKVNISLPEPEEIEAHPEDIPLDILFEDADIIVVNKPAGMVSHPSSGHTNGALVNALLFHCKDLSTINGKIRPGIVHRLDKDTSGCIVAAKNDTAHRALAEQFSGRTVSKEYVALCYGSPPQNEFECSGRIGRHPLRRSEMTIVRGEDEGREAYTRFKILERFRKGMFFVLAQPKTGRTHQIRVHLAKSGYPILADELYGREESLPELSLSRQALHAQKLSFAHPNSSEKLSFEARIPDDIENALRVLRGQ